MNAVRFLFGSLFVSSVLIPYFRGWGGPDVRRILLLDAWFMVWSFLLEVPTGHAVLCILALDMIALGALPSSWSPASRGAAKSTWRAEMENPSSTGGKGRLSKGAA